MGNIVIHSQSISTDEKASFASDTSFWSKLWSNYTSQFHEVIIHCWKEENAFIDELSPRAVSSVNEGLMKVLTINLNEANRLFLRDHSIDPRGGLKWFTMFFHVDGDERLEIGHYGSEIVLYKVEEEEVEKVVSMFSASIKFHYYADNMD